LLLLIQLSTNFSDLVIWLAHREQPE